MEKRDSIWSREIRLFPALAALRLPPVFSRHAAAVSVGLFIFYPFPTAVLCLLHRSFDYTVDVHRTIVHSCVWPLAALAAILAIASELWQAHRAGRRLWPFWKQNPVFLCFAVMVVWMLLSTTVNGWNTTILSGRGLLAETIYMQLGYFLLLFPAATMIRNVQTKRRLARLHEAVSLFMVPTAFILWKTQLTSVYYLWRPNFTAIYGNINHYGYYLAVAVSLSAAMFVTEQNKGWKLFSLAVLAANSVALSYNNTFGAWVAGLAAMLFLLITHAILERRLNKQALLAAAVFVVSLGLPAIFRGNLVANLLQFGIDLRKIALNEEGADAAGSGRWIIWQRGLELIRRNPVFGIGFDGIYVRHLKEYVRNNRVHNEYMEYALFYGIPAGLAYFSGCLGVFLRALRRRASLEPITLACLTAAFGYLVSAFFGITLFSTTPFLFLFLGMGYVTDDRQRLPPEADETPST